MPPHIQTRRLQWLMPMTERGGAGLRSQQQEAERNARELMDLKIEAAHLRERLRLRVGGDATAAELEAEAFALQGSLAEAQEALATRERELQALDGRYQKAMRGMLRLDEAWKASGQQTRELQEALRSTQQALQEAQETEKTLQEQLEAGNRREETLAARVDALMEEKQQVEEERDAQSGRAQRAEIQGRELRAQLEATRQNFETEMKQQEGATRADVKKLEMQLQKAVEDAAALRGEIHARQEEAAKVEAELKDTKEIEAATRQRLVKLTEDHAILRVHLEAAKQSEKESAERASKAETENERLKKELKERDDALREKEQAVRALEGELVQKQRTLEKELIKKKDAVEAAEQRLTTESQEMLQAQEETWSCREKVLQQEAGEYKLEIVRLQTFHGELAQLLQAEEGVKSEKGDQVVEPAQLRALVEMEIRNRETLSTLLEHTKTKLATTKRQLGSQKQIECENAKLRAEYERAKLAMERMATRKAKSFGATSSLPVKQSGPSSSSSSDKSNGKENRPSKGAVDPLAKRELEADEAGADLTLTPRKTQRTKRVYVASRYLSNASKR